MRSCTAAPSEVRPGPETPVSADRRAARRPRRRATSVSSGSTTTTPSAPSTMTTRPGSRSAAPAHPTTAGRPSDLEMMAVWLVGPPCSVTMASTCVGSRFTVSAGARSRATSTKGCPGSGTPGIGRPSRRATTRLRMSSRSAARSAMYGPAALSWARNSSKAPTTAAGAARPSPTSSPIRSARTGSLAIIAWAASTSAAAPAVAALRASRSVAVAESAPAADRSSASGSPDGWRPSGTVGGGASRSTGPEAIPGLTPIPVRWPGKVLTAPRPGRARGGPPALRATPGPPRPPC